MPWLKSSAEIIKRSRYSHANYTNVWIIFRSLMSKIKSCVKAVVSHSKKFIYSLELLSNVLKFKLACKKFDSDQHPLELFYENLFTNWITIGLKTLVASTNFPFTKHQHHDNYHTW